MRPIKHFEKGLTYIAGGLFKTVKSINQRQPDVPKRISIGIIR